MHLATPRLGWSVVGVRLQAHVAIQAGLRALDDRQEVHARIRELVALDEGQDSDNH